MQSSFMSHPTILWNHIGISEGSIPRDLQLGHDPSLGDPMPDITALAVGRKQLRFVSCHRISNTELLPPILCHIIKGRLNVLCFSAGQTLSLFARNSSYLCQRVVTMTCREWQRAQTRWAFSSSVSACANQLLCGTSSAMTRADLVGTTLEGTETFVSKTT